MAKTNINFNNKTYSIDESSLSTATNNLKSHLSTVMNGSGATINFGGTSYDIDSAKLQTATNAFVSHLGTIAGSGTTVSVNGTEYSVDSTKLQGAISEIEAVLGGVGEERLEGDGAEFYTLAPTALSFRSTAPLNELQEIQINGVTVDPANYTLEEGSTIVTFPIDYLKTLNVGSYEVAVASDSKTVKGDFTVAAPELNERGFYYNQPYTAYVGMFGENESFFIRDDGTMDIVGTPSGDISQATYSVNGNIITVVSPVVGVLTGTISADGTEIFCNELQTAFMVGNESIAADDDYIYIYKEDLGGYEVNCIDKMQSSYGAIKTGINSIDTVKLADDMFFDEYTESGNINMTIVPDIPNTVTAIGQRAFSGCTNIKTCKIPDSVTSIGYGAFCWCQNLADIELGKGVTFIDRDAFMNGSPNNVYITDLTAWCNISFGNASSNPCLNYTTMYINGTPVRELVIPDGVTTIYDRAFIHNGTIINVTIPNSVTAIGESAFSNCNNLTSVVIPDSVTTIGNSAFSSCNNLTSVVIPDSVTSIGNSAFSSCNNLTDIVFEGTTAQWNTITFGDKWNLNIPATYVQCSDGQVSLA